MSDEPEPVQIPVSWVGVDDLPLQFVNQFLTTTQGETTFLMVGSLQPPPIMGTAEEQRAQAEEVSFLPIKPTLRAALSLKSLKEFAGVLEQAIQNAERIVEQEKNS